jgi:hypothetical protein
MSGTPRPLGLCKLHGKSGLGHGQATRANTLVEASILVAEHPEEGGHGVALVVFGIAYRAQKECREAAPGEAICDLYEFGLIKLRTTDTSDPGTCEITMVW